MAQVQLEQAHCIEDLTKRTTSMSTHVANSATVGNRTPLGEIQQPPETPREAGTGQLLDMLKFRCMAKSNTPPGDTHPGGGTAKDKKTRDNGRDNKLPKEQ